MWSYLEIKAERFEVGESETGRMCVFPVSEGKAQSLTFQHLQNKWFIIETRHLNHIQNHLDISDFP